MGDNNADKGLHREDIAAILDNQILSKHDAEDHDAVKPSQNP